VHRGDENSGNWIKRFGNRIDPTTNTAGTVATYLSYILGLVVFCVSVWWTIIFAFNGRLSEFKISSPDANHLEIFAGIIGFLFSMLIFWIARRTEQKTDSLFDLLARAWPGIQTDYGAGNSNSSDNATHEIERHLNDIERGLLVAPEEPLDEVNLILSSIAYGIEHSANELGRFAGVLEHIARHPKRRDETYKRNINIAIWPIVEHQIIWGADRLSLRDKVLDQNNGITPSLRALINAESRAGMEWSTKLPSWCSSKERMFNTLVQLKKICRFFEYCKNNDRKIFIEVDEIDQWNSRAFSCSFGNGKCYSLFIATSPVSSTTLSASHWTSIGFNSDNMTSFNHLKHVYDTCVTARHSLSEPISSNPESDLNLRHQNSDEAVRRTRQFLETPYRTIQEYFLLGDNWENWTKSSGAFAEFYALIHTKQNTEIERQRQPTTVASQPARGPVAVQVAQAKED
jgi:hypothetical protein